MRPLVLALVALSACSRTPPPPAPSTTWVSSVKSWYCGPSPASPAPTPGAAQNMALRLTPTTDAVTGIFGIQEAGKLHTIGTVSQFKPVADRAATLSWKDDQKRKGSVELVFTPDFGSVTFTWKEGTAGVTGTTTLTASSASGCPAAPLIR